MSQRVRDGMKWLVPDGNVVARLASMRFNALQGATQEDQP